MTPKQKKLVENYIKKEVRKRLNEDSSLVLEPYLYREFENAKNSLNHVILSMVKSINNNSTHPGISKLREIRRDIRSMVDKLDYIQDDLKDYKG